MPLKVSFVDIRKAYFNALPKRDLHVYLPKELGAPKGMVGKLLRCVYGTRDAGQLWEDTYANFLISIGFGRGVGSPCCFHHPQRDISIVVHGDDFTALGLAKDLDWYEAQLKSAFEIKVRGRLGEETGDDREIRILNRVVRLDSDGVRYEADPRHAELIVKSLGLEKATPVSTPGVKDHDPDMEIVMSAEKNDDRPNHHVAVSAVHKRKPGDRTITFSPDITTHEVVPYGEVYGMHPRRLIATRHGRFKVVSGKMDAFTGKTAQ